MCIFIESRCVLNGSSVYSNIQAILRNGEDFFSRNFRHEHARFRFSATSCFAKPYISECSFFFFLLCTCITFSWPFAAWLLTIALFSGLLYVCWHWLSVCNVIYIYHESRLFVFWSYHCPINCTWILILDTQAHPYWGLRQLWIMQLSSEVSAQANLLIVHQQQLT